jgi:hypothetical protein
MEIAISIAVIALFWLGCAIFTIFLLGDIRPRDRELSKPRWARVLMVLGGPLTYVVVPVILIVAIIVESISIPESIANLRDATRKVLTNS